MKSTNVNKELCKEPVVPAKFEQCKFTLLFTFIENPPNKHDICHMSIDK